MDILNNYTIDQIVKNSKRLAMKKGKLNVRIDKQSPEFDYVYKKEGFYLSYTSSIRGGNIYIHKKDARLQILTNLNQSIRYINYEDF
jgi:hypothetical protein